MKQIVVYTALAAVLLLIPTQSSYAQASSDTVLTITKLESDGIKADLAGDKSWAEKFVADDWMGCDSDANWITKADVLKMIADTKNNKFTSEKLTDLKVRVYGNTAVATYKDTFDAMVKGQHRVQADEVTDVWVMVGAGWKLVSSQGTKAKS